MQTKSQKTAAKSAVKRNSAARASVRATKVVGRREVKPAGTAKASPARGDYVIRSAKAKFALGNSVDIAKLKEQVKRDRAARYTKRDIAYWCLIVALGYSSVWIIFFAVGA